MEDLLVLLGALLITHVEHLMVKDRAEDLLSLWLAQDVCINLATIDILVVLLIPLHLFKWLCL